MLRYWALRSGLWLNPQETISPERLAVPGLMWMVLIVKYLQDQKEVPALADKYVAESQLRGAKVKALWWGSDAVHMEGRVTP